MATAAAAVWSADGPSQPPKSTPAKAADNRVCAACHRDQEVDALAASHAKGGIGCVNCHGSSEKHAAEKECVTPPESMIAHAQLNDFCLRCHLQGNLSEQHEPLLDGKTAKKYCTECHGQHQMRQRTRMWDKATGKPLSKEAVKKENAQRAQKQ